MLERLLETHQKPGLLWVQGASDGVITNNSLSDAGTQGKLGLRPGWPGEDVFPPQPLLAEVTYALDQYERTGGAVRRLILPEVGHTPYLEDPLKFQAAILDHLEART